MEPTTLDITVAILLRWWVFYNITLSFLEARIARANFYETFLEQDANESVFHLAWLAVYGIAAVVILSFTDGMLLS